MVKKTMEERFWPKVKKGANVEDCWEWTAWVNVGGYGCFTDTDNKAVMAHRYSYELRSGPIPDGLVLDHLCRNRRCVNPAHLEPVTQRENQRRGVGTSMNVTHCSNGHELTPENTMFLNKIKNGKPIRGRRCKKCNAASHAAWQKKNADRHAASERERRRKKKE